MATLGNVMKRVKRDCRSANGLRVDDDTVKDAINDAIQHYRGKRFHFNEANAENGLAPTLTTVIGTTGYAFPSTLLELDQVLYLYSGYNYPLVKWSWAEQAEAVGDTTSSRGPGRYYAIHGNTIHVFPPPDQVTTITLTGLVALSPTTFDNETATNAWLQDGLSLIRARASWDLMLNVLANRDRAADFKTTELDALGALHEETESRIATGAAVVPDWEHV